MPNLGKTSLERLQGVKSPLIDVIHQAIKGFDFTVLPDGGVRTVERQAELVASGASKTMDSKHLTGNAVDIAPYPIRWPDKGKHPETYVKDIARFYAMLAYIRGVADSMGVSVRTGDDWDRDWDFTDQKFDDLCHVEYIGG